MSMIVKIYPPIGIARIGNSTDSFYVGPELPNQVIAPPSGYKDPQGRIKRQAARFRLFAYQENVLIGEVTPAIADISWTVEVANTKASWYIFAGVGHTVQPLRNAKQGNRNALNIKPGPRSVTATTPRALFDTGAFVGIPVPLGEIRMDADGRLLVLGGFGHAATSHGYPLNDYVNNDGWYDDVSDGPVTATVTFKDSGLSVQATGGWVICAPPRYAPPINHIITLYDTLLQVAVDRLGFKVPTPPSFTNDIYPLLERAVSMQWVNSHPGTGHNLLQDVIPPPGTLDQRSVIFNHLRNPATPYDQPTPGHMPAIWSDYFPFLSGDWFNQPLTATQYQAMQDWRDGNFTNDWIGPPAPSTPVTPSGLTQAALMNCIGGAFAPGVETSYLTRDVFPYMEPFRLDGPKLHAGDLTKQLAVPWQADFLDCSYESPLLWWPAARPDQVFPATGGPQIPWARGIQQYQDMVNKWSKLGFLVQQGNQIVETESQL